MSTRAAIHFVDDTWGKVTPMATIYHHGDGYPKYLGIELARCMPKGNVRNGMRGNENREEDSNGFGCFAASTIMNLKEAQPLGTVYLSGLGEDQEYNYTVKGEESQAITITVVGHGEEIFSGSISELDEFSRSWDFS